MSEEIKFENTSDLENTIKALEIKEEYLLKEIVIHIDRLENLENIRMNKYI